MEIVWENKPYHVFGGKLRNNDQIKEGVLRDEGAWRDRERERKRAGNVLSSGEDRLHFCNVSTEFLMFVCSIVIC